MPRELTNESMKLSLYDNLSDSEIEMFYRLPTTEEQIKYDNSFFRRERNNIIPTIGATRIKYGEKILTGIGDSSFVVRKDGKMVPLHSREDSEYYDPAWKETVVKMAPDIISRLAFVVFEASVQRNNAEERTDLDDGRNPT